MQYSNYAAQTQELLLVNPVNTDAMVDDTKPFKMYASAKLA